ncbi:hypothetical protein [Roseateles depolymerans]|uniref:Uncharacterized protein n=1 Tax=Roseateles depolymerans TaxID=76731 RepID=A0A0U3MTA5_9BURK|nr:hypothetical protein [Roseateles depolymerans]ALV07578.1 hypothetical protein RD2015_3117 [Roseateles depolymerans]REG22206.1 hypothetical protein DES44_1350 [Roseateles depolymerans]
MSAVIAPVVAAVAQTATSAVTDAATSKLETLMGQRMFMQFQQNQQAMNKSMSKMTDQIKASMQDDE